MKTLALSDLTPADLADVVATRQTGATITLYQAGDPIPAQALPEAAAVLPVSVFRERFTPAELKAITALAFAGDADVQVMLLKLQTNTDGIDLAAPEVVAGLAYLVSQGALSAGRRDAILALPTVA